MKNIKILMLLFLMGLIGTGCEEDEGSPELTAPANLIIATTPSEDKPGEITVTFSAENVNYYRVYFGVKDNEKPVEARQGSVTYAYTESGTYTIKVRAHATDAVYIEKTQEITIQLEDDNGDGGEDGEISDEGYTTPESYDGMTLVWQDEFEGDALNMDNWSFEKGTGEWGWGNNELQYYREENTAVSDGYLIITAKEEEFEGSQYTSSRIITKGKQSFQYGRIDMRAKLPHGQGMWPALWMLGDNFDTEGWPKSGEIDMMEMVGGGVKDGQVHGTLHWETETEGGGKQHASYGSGNANGPYTLGSGKFADEFHVFTLIWDENAIKWFVDDEQFFEVDIRPEDLSEFHQKFFLIFNVAVGGQWPGSPDASTTFPQRMVVDYVRVFQEN